MSEKAARCQASCAPGLAFPVQDTQRAKPADEEEDGFILDHLEEPAAGPASSYLSTAITAEELLEIQQHLLAKAPASKGRGNKQRQVLSSDSEEDDDTASTSGQGQANDVSARTTGDWVVRQTILSSRSWHVAQWAQVVSAPHSLLLPFQAEDISTKSRACWPCAMDGPCAFQGMCAVAPFLYAELLGHRPRACVPSRCGHSRQTWR